MLAPPSRICSAVYCLHGTLKRLLRRLFNSFRSVQPEIQRDSEKALYDPRSWPAYGRPCPTRFLAHVHSILQPLFVPLDSVGHRDPRQLPPPRAHNDSTSLTHKNPADADHSSLPSYFLPAPPPCIPLETQPPLEPSDICPHCPSEGGCSLREKHALYPCGCPNDCCFTEQTTAGAWHSVWCSNCGVICHSCGGSSAR